MALTSSVDNVFGRDKTYQSLPIKADVNPIFKGSALMFDTATDLFVVANATTGLENFGGIAQQGITDATGVIQVLKHVEIDNIPVAGTVEAGMQVFLAASDNIYTDCTVDATDALLIGFVKRPYGPTNYTVIFDVLYACAEGGGSGGGAEGYFVAADEAVIPDIYEITTTPVMTLEAGQHFTVLAPNADCTAGGVTLTVNHVVDAVVDGEGGALLARDVVTTLPMDIVFDGTNHILLNPATRTTWKDDAANVLSIVDDGAANDYFVETDPAYPLTANLRLTLLAPAGDNTGAATLTYNTDMDAILDGEGNALAAGAIVTTCPAELQFDGANWILLNSALETTRKANNPIILFSVDPGTGGADNYYAVTDPVPVLAAGIVLFLDKPVGDSSGAACKLTFNTVEDAILVAGGGAPAATDIQTDCPAELYFDGTNWILMNPQA